MHYIFIVKSVKLILLIDWYSKLKVIFLISYLKKNWLAFKILKKFKKNHWTLKEKKKF